MSLIVRVATGVLCTLVSGFASAGFIGRVPEPGMLELLALGGVVALVIGIRNSRK